MNNKDVLDMLKRTYSDNAPDVLQNLDFNKIEKEEAKVIPVKRKYYTAAAIYAAACLVVAIALPFLIGRGTDGPKPIPGHSVSSETVMSGDDQRVNDPPETKAPVEIMTDDTDIIDEFMAALDRAVAEGRITGSYDKKDCVNVTPVDVFEETGARLFKFADSSRTFIYADGEAYEVLGGEADPGTTGVVPCNFDGDGELELLLSVPTNNKRVETELVLFSLDSKTSETVGSITYNIAAVTRDTDDAGSTVYPVKEAVFTVDTDNRFMLMPKAGDKLYGYVELVDGKVFLVAVGEQTDSAESGTVDTADQTESESERDPETVAPEKPEPETEKRPSIVEPMVSSTKYTTPAETTTPKETEPPVTTPAETEPPHTTRPTDELEPDRTYDDPAGATRLRFFADKEMRAEYNSHKDIPYGAKVYYAFDSTPGYICTNLIMNVYEIGCEKERIDGTYSYYNYFINTYDGDELEYKLTGVLGGDFDRNREYNLKDVTNALWYIARHPNWYYAYGSNGYAAILDYNCDGRTNALDVSGMMREIAGWNVVRDTMTMYKYNAEAVCSTDHLISLDKAEIVVGFAPKYASGTGYNIIGDEYVVINSVDEAIHYNFTDELLAKYNAEFFEKHDLAVYCIHNSEGSVVKLDKVWMNQNHGIILRAEYENTWEPLIGEPKTVCIPVGKNIGITENVPG